MKLGDVLRKERSKLQITAASMADRLDMAEDDYLRLESGESPIEVWGPRLARIAIRLETPTSRLLAESGQAADTEPGQAGRLIRRHRERHDLTPEGMAEALELTAEEYAEIEAGESPLERHGPTLLAFAEAIDQPVFNLFYPCGLPFQELDDYP